MFDNKTLKVQSAQETLFPRLKCLCVRLRGVLQNGQANYTELQARPNDQTHTKYVKMSGYESIHLNIVYVDQNSLEKIRCVSIYCLKVTDWRLDHQC